MKNTTKVISNIDFAMLNNQKMTLLRLMDTILEDEKQYDDVQGIINMIDSIQDAIVRDGFRTEAEVFGMDADVKEAIVNNILDKGFKAISDRADGGMVDVEVKFNDLDEEREFINYYRCPNCGDEWDEVWTSMCDSECGVCDMENISPYKSEEIK